MKLSEATKPIHVWITEDIFEYAKMCRQKRLLLDEKVYYQFYRSRIGIIGNCFYSNRANVILPYVTEEAAKLKSGSRTLEHVSSRLRCAKQILDRVISNPNVRFNRILAYVVVSCRVVQTTHDENKKLEKRRKKHLADGNKTIPWRHMYKLELLNLLLRDLNEYRKYYYMIEGNRYESAAEAAEDYSITPSEVDTRALNKNSYLDWEKYSIETGERVYRKVYNKKPKKNNKDSQKYVYKIEGVIYNDVKELLSNYNIDYGTLVSRCKSKKWKDWHQIKKEAA